MDKPTAPEAELHILIAGRMASVNEGLAEYITELPGLRVIGTANTSLRALHLADTLSPDVVLFDLDTAGRALAGAVEVLGQVSPSPTIIVLAHETTGTLRRRCHALGVRYIFNKTTELIPLVKQLHFLREEKLNLPQQ